MRCMSSDGTTDKPRPARPGRSDDRGLASIALGVLLALAVVATVVMVFSDNPVWMRVGTLAALWAAFIGAFLVARYRRQAAAEASRVRDLHTVYELQLEREISARREHELVVEKELRDTVRIETSESILALRHEIAALREQLGAMGVDLPEDRYAVGGLAPAGELGAGAMPSVPSERVEPRRGAHESAGRSEPTASWAYTSSSSLSSSGSSSDTATPPPPSRPATPRPGAASAASEPVSGFGASSTAPAPAAPATTGVGPDATPSTERTEKFSPVSGRPTRTETPAGEPRRPAVRPAAAAEKQQATPAAPAAPVTPSAPTAPAEPAEPTPPPSRHGQGTGLSVAELMAKLGGDDAPSGGRRRRRAED